tara:strand:- start:1313 stop:1528 length:216 start_codon:yes stop_codon:yes gene_type:complete
MVTLELTEQQAVVLNQLIDISVKTAGLGVAEAALFFSNSIKSQLTQEESVVGVEDEKVEEVEVEEAEVTIA